MAKRVIVKNQKYAGKFVAMESFNKRTVVASGTDPDGVIQRAEQKGYNSPVVMFVPDKKMINVY